MRNVHRVLSWTLLAAMSPLPALAQDATGVVISQFASRGPAGANDDFIELFNAGTSAVDITGWTIQQCSGSTTATVIERGVVNGSFVLQPRRYYLFASPTYSRPALADAEVNQIPDFVSTTFAGRSGFRLVDATGAVRDGAGSPVSGLQPAGSHCREGAGRNTPSTGIADVAFLRRLVGGQPQDADDNALDFPGDALPSNPRNSASPAAPAATPRPTVNLSASPASISEAGGVATITATLSAPFTNPVSVGLRFAGVAINEVDYTASAATIEIAAGASSGTVTLTAIDDSLFEGEETITVLLGSLGNAVAGSSDRVAVTIADNETVPVVNGARIYQIQGAAHRSPLVGQTVTSVPGIVTAIAADGFYLQDPDGDGNVATSDAVFVRTSGAPMVTVGSKVAVNGSVREFRPGGPGGVGNLSVTEIGATSVSASSFPFTNATVTPTTIGSGGRVPPVEVIDNDSTGNVENTAAPVFDPAQDGIDFFESLEGMLVQVANARVIGPTDASGNLWVIGDNGANTSGSNARGGLTVIERSAGVIDLNPERIRLIGSLAGGLPGIVSPVADVGDTLPLARGVLGYNSGSYALQLTATPTLTRNGLPADGTRLAFGSNRLTVASYALGSLLPGNTARMSRIAAQIVAGLGGPDLVHLTGIGDDSGTANDDVVAATATIQGLLNAIGAAGGPAYIAVTIDPANNADGGPAGANIRTVQLYNPARIGPAPTRFASGAASPVAALTAGATTGPLTLNLSPSLVRPQIPAFAGSRKPLAASYRFNGRNLLVIGNHFAETTGDDPLYGLGQPPLRASEAQRRQQATAVHAFVRSALALDANAKVIALGDFNADDFLPPLRILRNGPLGTGDSEGTLPALVNLGSLRVADAAERYTQIIDGNGRAADHILVTEALNDPGTEVQYVHLNSEYADRAGERDAVLASLPLSPNIAPTAVASADPPVEIGGASISLIGDSSFDSDGAVVRYEWLQVAGPEVGVGNLAPTVSFVTPDDLDTDTEFRFQLTVTDNDGATGSTEVAATVTARSGDFTPDPFSFTAITGVEPGSEQTSNEIVVSGVDTFANLTISNGSYSRDGGPFDNFPTQVYAGERIRVRNNAAATLSTTVTTTLTLSGVSADFSVRTREGNMVPSPFGFTGTTDANPGAAVVSNTVMITGLEAPSPISIAGGLYSINGAPFTAAPGTVVNLDAVRVQQTASAAFATTTVATVTIGGVAGSYSVTTRVADTVPDAFAFAQVTDAEPGSTVTSAPAIITGLEAPAAVSVSGGLYSINGGAFTSAMIGTVSNGDSVRVQLSASTSFTTTTVATLTIGGTSAPFSVTTRGAPDTIPDAFAFTPVTGAEPNALVISNAITVTGINSATPVSVSGGLYSVNGGPFVSASALVNAGDSLRVQLTAASTPATTTSATLDIGGTRGAFTVTTQETDTTPGSFSFAALNGVEPGTVQVSEAITVSGLDGRAAISVANGRYAINGSVFTTAAGTVANGDTVRVQLRASAQFSTPVSATLTIGTVSSPFTVTTRPANGVPDSFSFAAVTGAEPGALTTSNAIVIGGLESRVAISITGGLYSVNNGAFTALAGLVGNGDTVSVQLTASPTPSTTVVATTTIGGVAAPFSVTTRAADTTPNGFSFAPQTNVEPRATVSSGAIVISGLEAAAGVTVVDGLYSVNGGPFGTATGTVVNGDNLRLMQTASGEFATTSTAILTVGGVSGTFSVTTRSADVIPDAFTIPPASGAAPGTAVISDTFFVTGLEVPVPITVADGRYSINGAAFTAEPGLVGNGAALRVEHIAAADYVASSRATLTIGGVSGSFSVGTRAADTSPDAFSFAAIDGASLLAEQISAPITVSGIEVATPISVQNGAYSINDGPFVTPVGLVSNGDRVRVRHVSSNRPGMATVTTLAIGDRSAPFRSTTAPAVVDPGPGPGPSPGTSSGGGAIDPLWLLALLALRRRRSPGRSRP